MNSYFCVLKLHGYQNIFLNHFMNCTSHSDAYLNIRSLFITCTWNYQQGPFLSKHYFTSYQDFFFPKPFYTTDLITFSFSSINIWHHLINIIWWKGGEACNCTTTHTVLKWIIWIAKLTLENNLDKPTHTHISPTTVFSNSKDACHMQCHRTNHANPAEPILHFGPYLLH